MCLRLSARRILQRYASNLTHLVSSDKIRHVFVPIPLCQQLWTFLSLVSLKNAKYLEARILVQGDPGESCCHCWQSDEWNDWEGERCQTEASLSWKKPPVVLRAIKLYCAWTEMITKPISPTWPLSNMPEAFSTLSQIWNEMKWMNLFNYLPKCLVLECIYRYSAPFESPLGSGC